MAFPYQNEFKYDCQSLGYNNHTIESYLSNIRLFFEYIQTPPEEISNTQLNKFLRYLRYEKEIIKGNNVKIGAAKSTIKTYFSSLHAYYDYLEYNGFIDNNPIPKFRRRYLKHIRKAKGPDNTRQLVSIRQMAELVYSIEDPLERAILTVLAKTGVRRGELITMDLDDLDLSAGTIYLKPTAKRANQIVFIDQETIDILQVYLDNRPDKGPALFIKKTQRQHTRIHRNFVYKVVCSNAEKIGLHDPAGPLIKKFTPHCCRHWFTTNLRRAGMSREFRQALRGDMVKDAVDIYDHIDHEELRTDYLDKIPQLKDALSQPGRSDHQLTGRQTNLFSFP